MGSRARHASRSARAGVSDGGDVRIWDGADGRGGSRVTDGVVPRDSLGGSPRDLDGGWTGEAGSELRESVRNDLRV